VFNDVDLLELKELESCNHRGKSFVDTNTLLKSGEKLPQIFLRGIGLPDKIIEYLPSLSTSAIQYYTCFISYSHKDELFTQRLHNDLQNKDVRCWFAPEDMKTGDEMRDTVFQAIRFRDKLLLILSGNSVNSEWVKDEVDEAIAEEHQRKQTVLFPITIDNTVMTSDKAWAKKIRNDRHIGDFRKWKKPAEYEKAFNRLLRDLKVNQGKNI